MNLSIDETCCGISYNAKDKWTLRNADIETTKIQIRKDCYQGKPKQKSYFLICFLKKNTANLQKFCNAFVSLLLRRLYFMRGSNTLDTYLSKLSEIHMQRRSEQTRGGWVLYCIRFWERWSLILWIWLWIWGPLWVWEKVGLGKEEWTKVFENLSKMYMILRSNAIHTYLKTIRVIS